MTSLGGVGARSILGVGVAATAVMCFTNGIRRFAGHIFISGYSGGVICILHYNRIRISY